LFFSSAEFVEQNLKHKEKYRKNNHARRYNDGSELEFVIDGSRFVPAEERVGAAGKRAYVVVGVSALYQNDYYHAYACNNEQYHKRDAETEIYVRRRR
jgi:hypothetical protein